MERLLSRKQAAEYLGIPEGTLAELRRRAGLPAVRIGRVYRYRAADLDEYLKAKSVNLVEITEESPPGRIALAILHELRRLTSMLSELSTGRLP